ncbi:hypothetical protein [Gemmobacter sp. LW-1]|uniref:hypothetical protein n=1 Tax=Gemmobacter sp. LW-1 TaxID=1529005 RepID=UPI00128EF8D3|nr:hypothetical protein [Gemmobacter sp. LW-1]
MNEKRKQPRGVTNRALRLRLGHELGLPELGENDRNLIVAFRECGISKSGFAGAIPLEWPDILAFAISTGSVEDGTDMGILFHMCRAYCSAHDEARNDAMVIAPAERSPNT